MTLTMMEIVESLYIFSSSDTDARTEAAIFIKEMQDFHWKNSPMRESIRHDVQCFRAR